MCLTGFRVLNGEQSWVHHYQPESKCASMQWKHLSSPSTKKIQGYEYAISWERYAYSVLGFSGSTVSPFSETWWKCEICLVLWSFRMQFAGNFLANWQVGTASSWQCQIPYSPSNPGGNSRTIVGTSWTSASQPGLCPNDFPLLGLLKTTLVENVSLMMKWLKRKCRSGWDKRQKTSMMRVSTHW
jgi:hypothetical protein